MASRARIILHGKQADNDELRSAIRAARSNNDKIDVRVTWEDGDAKCLAAEAVAAGVEIVIAAGGDGTLSEVVSGLLGESRRRHFPSLGVIPLGTANDFAKGCGIPLDCFQALQLILQQPSLPVDVGSVGSRFFINVATGGVGAEITAETPDELKRVLGRAAYFATGLTKFGSLGAVPTRLSGPHFHWQGNLLVLAVGNGRQAGGGNLLCPSAKIDDGLFDVVIVPALPWSQLTEVLGALIGLNATPLDELTVQARVPWLEMKCDRPLMVNLDGEPVEAAELRFEILPAALRVHLVPSPLYCENVEAVTRLPAINKIYGNSRREVRDPPAD